ncbi:plasmid pRiA4b ORF-3 family protein [uncultured Sphingobacterium sp.]|uniref:plasmid pRiA4b ORF-3 family protein n=1 Tax=uncultured Sphingobacterium sp. TaxID=182688 RepID=UPI0025D43183|nr:plasmid pRiA4b ORF-3 family protein [uncultured Sphingobacterium sp.]
MLLQLKIQIKGITKPPVWRKLLVPDYFTFDRLHQVIQEAFGWQNYHLYQFSPKGFGSYPEIAIIDEEWDEGNTEDAELLILKDILNQTGQKFTYIYDFGDSWTHQIVVEDILDKHVLKAKLLEGKGACPPEDCGSTWGYKNVKDVMKDIHHEEHDEMRTWLGLEKGEKWDPNYFDLQAAKKRVAAV